MYDKTFDDLEIIINGKTCSGKTMLLGEIAYHLSLLGYEVETYDDMRKVNNMRPITDPKRLQKQNIKISTNLT